MKKLLLNLWHGETPGLTTAAIIVGGASLASRLVGVLRDRILAAHFGAGSSLDAYYAAFRLPDLLYTLIILGALSAGFVPVFAEYMKTKGEEEAWRLAERVLSVIGATMLVICAGLVVFAPQIVPLTVPGFTPEQLDTTIRLTRIMALSPFFLGLSAVMGGVLQATRRFLAFSLAPVFYNFGIIIGATILSPMMGLEGLAWGVVIGAFLHLVTQASVAFRLGLKRIPPPSLRTEGVRRILWLMAPRTAGLAVGQVNLVILQALASALPVGSITVFNLANNIQNFPFSIFAISFSVAAFSSLSLAAGAKNISDFQDVLSSATRKINFFLIPSTVIFIILRAQIVRLTLGAGVFNWNDTIRTADVLGIFAASLVFQGLAPLFARAFYALQDTWTPLISGIVSEVLNLGFALWLRGPFGIMGLALAYSLSSTCEIVILWLLLRRRTGPLSSGTWISMLKTTAASMALLGFGWVARQAVGTLLPLQTFWEVALQIGATLLVGGLGFILVARLLRSEELEELLASVRRRFIFLKNQAIPAGSDEGQGL